jgi:hypothetical protein
VLHVDTDVTHAFARVPEVLSQAEWLATRGMGFAQQKVIEGKATEVCPDAPKTLDARLRVCLRNRRASDYARHQMSYFSEAHQCANPSICC